VVTALPANSVFLDLPAVISEMPRFPKKGNQVNAGSPVLAIHASLLALPLGDDVVLAQVMCRDFAKEYSEKDPGRLDCCVYSSLSSVQRLQFTVCVKTADVLPRSFTLPEYTAVIECASRVSVEVERVAFPALSVPPSTVVPFLNVTVPVGVPLREATAATVVVNVTD